MCEPTLIMAGVSAGLSAAQGFSQKSAYDQQAKNSELEARQRLQAGGMEANRVRDAGDRKLGEIRAIQSASGVDMTGGSAADVAGQAAANIESDALDRLYAGRLGAWQNRYKAQLAKSEGRSAMIGGLANAATTLAGAGGKGGFFDSAPGQGKYGGVTPRPKPLYDGSW